MKGCRSKSPRSGNLGTRPGARLMLVRRFRGQGGAPRMPNIAFRLQRFQLGGKKWGHAGCRGQKKPLIWGRYRTRPGGSSERLFSGRLGRASSSPNPLAAPALAGFQSQGDNCHEKGGASARRQEGTRSGRNARYQYLNISLKAPSNSCLTR